MPTKIQNMANIFPIKEKSWVITISFTSNVRVHIWGCMGGAPDQFVEGNSVGYYKKPYRNLKTSYFKIVFHFNVCSIVYLAFLVIIHEIIDIFFHIPVIENCQSLPNKLD